MELFFLPLLFLQFYSGSFYFIILVDPRTGKGGKEGEREKKGGRRDKKGDKGREMKMKFETSLLSDREWCGLCHIFQQNFHSGWQGRKEEKEGEREGKKDISRRGGKEPGTVVGGAGRQEEKEGEDGKNQERE